MTSNCSQFGSREKPVVMVYSRRRRDESARALIGASRQFGFVAEAQWDRKLGGGYEESYRSSVREEIWKSLFQKL